MKTTRSTDGAELKYNFTNEVTVTAQPVGLTKYFNIGGIAIAAADAEGFAGGESEGAALIGAAW